MLKNKNLVIFSGLTGRTKHADLNRPILADEKE